MFSFIRMGGRTGREITTKIGISVMTSNYQDVLTWTFSTLLGIGSYTGIFLYLLGIKFLRHAADFRGKEILIVTDVVLGTSAFVVTLTAVFFIFFDRVLSGRFFFISVIFGSIIVLLSSAEIVTSSQSPFKVALGLGKYKWIGLIVGNSLVVLGNVASFFCNVPSLL